MDAYICGPCCMETLPRLIIITQWDLQGDCTEPRRLCLPMERIPAAPLLVLLPTPEERTDDAGWNRRRMASEEVPSANTNLGNRLLGRRRCGGSCRNS
ncbi:hypothetical protein VZT92_017581 [Zoarces viviparus]|uniref:Uncharacterized protein n=1 Tax=Zoarces viviparus TaxID=48416 RepID=A0AAW1ELW1_ZOAVI